MDSEDGCRSGSGGCSSTGARADSSLDTGGCCCSGCGDGCSSVTGATAAHSLCRRQLWEWWLQQHMSWDSCSSSSGDGCSLGSCSAGAGVGWTADGEKGAGVGRPTNGEPGAEVGQSTNWEPSRSGSNFVVLGSGVSTMSGASLSCGGRLECWPSSPERNTPRNHGRWQQVTQGLEMVGG